MKPLTLFLMLALAATVRAGQPQSAESYKLLYLADSGIAVLQLSVEIDGTSPEASFEKYIDALMKDLDKNNDGIVTVEEARGKIMTAREVQVQLGTPATSAQEISPDLSPKDGKISDEEREAALQIFEMVLAFGQQERRALRLQRFEHIVENQVIARLVLGEGGIDHRHGGAVGGR